MVHKIAGFHHTYNYSSFSHSVPWNISPALSYSKGVVWVLLIAYNKDVFAKSQNFNRIWLHQILLPTVGRRQIWHLNPFHDDVIKWRHFPRYWPFVRGIHRSPVNSPHKGQWRGTLMFSLICVWINGWVNNGEAGDLRRHRLQYDVIVMLWKKKLLRRRECKYVLVCIINYCPFHSTLS